VKQFRGSLIALVILVLLGGAYWASKPADLTPKERKAAAKKVEGIALFVFEKADLVRIDVQRPDGLITLLERPDSWWIEGSEMRASRQMVNRVKHQLHDLVSRATVVEDSDDPSLYGLGPSAIGVKLTMRDGTIHEFEAGDPNPTGVSFYVRKKGDGHVYTVKKSAMDYYSLGLEDFRERRFASFDSKDVDVIDATLPGGKRLRLQRTGERLWDLLEPQAFAAADMEVRSLLGRISAMKAIRFEGGEVTDLAQYGLAAPRARIEVRFSGGRTPVVLLLGAPTGESEGEYPLAWAMLEGEPFVYVVRDVFLADFQVDPAELRLRRFSRVDENELTSLTSTFSPRSDSDRALAGVVTVRHAASEWQWDDGVIAPGSTPRRVASRAANLASVEFVATEASDSQYGFDQPVLRIDLVSQGGEATALVIGKEAPSATDREGNPRKRWFARNLAYSEVYLVDDGLIDVVEDLHREHGRHARGEAEEEERAARIEAERKKVREAERLERIEKRKSEGAKGGAG
jgi:hypothetical protein